MVVLPHPSGETAHVGYDGAWLTATPDQVAVMSTFVGPEPAPGRIRIEASAVGPLYVDLEGLESFVAGLGS